MLMGLCEAKTAEVTAENVDTVMRKTYYINSKNAVSKTARSERRLFLNAKSFEEIVYLFSVSRKLIRIEIEKRTSDSFTHIKTASFFKQRSQRFYLFHIDHFSHPLPVEIGDQVSLVHKDLSVPALAGADGLHLTLLHKLTDGVFGKTADECGALLDGEHLHLVGGRCFGGLRSGVLSVLGELTEQLQNVVYDLFLSILQLQSVQNAESTDFIICKCSG